MTEMRYLRAALRELLDKCSEEYQTARARASHRLDSSVESYLGAAEDALQRLACSEDEKECSALAREVLGAVASLRNRLETSSEDAEEKPQPQSGAAGDREARPAPPGRTGQGSVSA